MPSITIRFDWDQTIPYPEGYAGQALAEMSSFLQHELLSAYTADGPDLMGYDGPLVDEVTLDAIVDDGRGITRVDTARIEAGYEVDAKARARVEEYHTEEA